MRSCWPYEQTPTGIRLRYRSRPPEARLYGSASHGSHIIMRRDDPFAQTVVPNHKQIDRGTLRAILRQIEITAEELIKLL